MRTVIRQIVSAVIIAKDNKILMGQKDPKKGGVFSDCWHIPGGGIEENEDKIDTLIREINEEVGIDLSNKKIQLISDNNTATAEKTLRDTNEKILAEMHFFVYKININLNSESIKIQPGDDLVILKWFEISSLSSVKLTPPSIVLFKQIGWL
jgi:8-oxo-dGTP pyrophosphatase MutT (NUDIX family)